MPTPKPPTGPKPPTRILDAAMHILLLGDEARGEAVLPPPPPPSSVSQSVKELAALPGRAL
ncbi:hypothetical protein EYF80_032669 [Liparis tanakae]|uniref:Uncharacterized protein n=1 Tax=Liparis tanakae TaxID=230148 RepID=A0A4Z2GWX0_9TELE|nr:hypothetical protein EYF80_032669 [Liparis tanakae]